MKRFKLPQVGPDGRKSAHFLVQGSAVEPYEVRFLLDGRNLSAYCTCPAGQHGQYCKHRFSILDGATKGIVSDNLDVVAIVAGWLEGTDVAKALEKVRELEAQEARLKEKLRNAKKDIARRMRD